MRDGRFRGGRDQLQEAVFEFFAGGDLVHRAGRAHQTVVDYGHMRAHLFDQCHHVRRDNHRAAGLRVFDEDVFEVGAGHRVHGFKRLVQDQNARAMNHRGGQADLLGHAGRIIGDHRVGGPGQVESIEQVLGATRGLIAAHAAQHAGVDEQLQTGQSVEDLVGLGHDADHALGRVHVAPHVMAQNHGGAGVRYQ